ncbi:hypothetical protein [Noviherbaspirillum autotrophicum]|uniref:hypothetical protein n=1 Tax=Noviherbaspirillum autotrophicum TaxID=709839 RepID=UPI000588F17C|nr:hypothetical protein [Noviherbaspirillum autotrophicum]
MYSLKNIRRIRGLDGSGVTASIYRGGLRVGWVQIPADGGAALFTFDSDGDRAPFEEYVEHWWDTSQTQVSFELTAVEFARATPGFTPRLHAKLKYWVTALVGAATQVRKFSPAP